MFIKKKHSFKERLAVAFILVGIIPLCILAIYNLAYTFKATKNNIKSYTESNMKTSVTLINNSIVGFKNMVEFITNNEEVKKVMKEDKNNISKEEYFNHTQKLYNISTTLISTFPEQMPLHIVGTNKKSRFSTTDYYSPIYNGTRGDFYKRMDQNPDIVVSQIHRRYDEVLGKDIVMVFGKAIVDEKSGKIIGYVIIEISDNYFNRFIDNISFFKDTNVYIIDSNRYIITDKINKNETGFKIDIESIENKDFKNLCYITKGDGYIKILSIIPTKNILKELYSNIKVFLVIVIITLTIIITVVSVLSSNISKPVHEMNLMMKEVQDGNRNVQVTYRGNDEIGDLSIRFNNMIKEINRLIDKEYNQRLLIKQAEFKALKAQINPHFLYNALSSINWMAKLGEKNGVVEMTNALSRFFRYSCKNDEEKVVVKEEINQIKNYLTIQKYRYGDKLNIEINLQEEVLEKHILKLILQPIVENAIVHGLEEKIGNWKLIIKGYMSNENIVFEVMDNGIGFGNSTKKGEGIGIKNVDERIKIEYGEIFGANHFEKDDMTIFQIKFPSKIY